MKHIVSFSGWGQSARSLLSVVPGSTPVDYMRYGSLLACFAALSDLPCEVAVGWSLGGQVAIRAIAEKVIRPKLLVLIATPFCFSHPYAEAFYQTVAENPDNALKRFSLMMTEGDSCRKNILRLLEIAPSSPHIGYWLRALYDFDGKSIDFSAFPPTLIIQGGKDSIVQAAQAEILANKIPQSHVVMLEDAAHVPHLHDSEKLRKLIEDYVA